MPKYPVLSRMLALNPDMAKSDPFHVLNHILADLKIRTDMDDELRSNRAWLVATEGELIHAGTPSLFVSSRELLNFLWESTYSPGVFNEGVWNIPAQFFCFPQATIEGVSMRSCIFGNTNHLFAHLGIKEKILFYCGLPHDRIDFRSWERHRLDQILSRSKHADESYLCNREEHMFSVLVRLCMATVVYATAFPDYVIDGLPEDVKATNIHKPRILRAAPEIIHGATRTSVSMHIRAGHFKTLQHERFKRNEDGTAKVIFVRQTVVAGKLTPKTAVGL